jgi:hypothetical protein
VTVRSYLVPHASELYVHEVDVVDPTAWESREME